MRMQGEYRCECGSTFKTEHELHEHQLNCAMARKHQQETVGAGREGSQKRS